MYYIASTSTTVGTAIADINKTTISMPEGFSKGSSDDGSLELINKNNDENIYLKDLGKLDSSKDAFDKKIKSLKTAGDVTINGNKTNVFNNVSTYTVYYTNSSDSDAYNRSMSYVYCAGHTFYIKMAGYTDIDKLNSDLEYIVSTMQPDYKKSQD
ncbi:hypothetical protein [Methanobrevibacter sp.]